MMHKAWCTIEEMPYYFSRSSIKFQGHTGWKIDDLSEITRPVAAIKSLRFALFYFQYISFPMSFGMARIIWTPQIYW